MAVITADSRAADEYVRALSAAYRQGRRVPDPSYAALSDPEIWDKIRRDPDIAADVQKRRHKVAGRAWQVEPRRAGRDDDVRAARVVETLVDEASRLTEARFLLSEAIFRGSAYLYIEGEWRDLEVDGVEGEWWVPVRLRHMDPLRFRQRSDGKGHVVWQLWSVLREKWEDLGPDELRWVVRHVYEDTESALGHGRGLVEAIYYFWWFKSEALKKGMQGLDRWALGMLNAKIQGLRAGSQANVTRARKWRDTLQKMREDNVLVSDREDEVEVLTGGMEGHQMVMAFVDGLQKAITRLILGAVLPSGGGGETGSMARAVVEEGAEEELIEYDRVLIDETLSRDLIGCLWWYNRANLARLGLASAQLPRFTTSFKGRPDPAERATTAGLLLDRGLPLKTEDLYEQTGWARPDAEDEVFTAPQPAPSIAPADPFALPFDAASLRRAFARRRVR